MIERLLCDFYRKNNLPYRYCEIYTCCGQIPCKYNSDYQKNHDFDLNLPIKDDQKYVFLYRKNKIEQLEAYYRYTYKNTSNDYTSQTEYNNLIQFYNDKSYYYDELVNKYVHSNRDNMLCIDYNEFVNEPHKEFYKIITFFEGTLNKTQSIDQIHQFIEDRPEKIIKQHQLDDELVNKISNEMNSMFRSENTINR
jgi:hypothetical protein